MSVSQPLLLRLLNRIEQLGNRLPHPTALFVYLCLFIIVLSGLSAVLELSARHPGTGDELVARSLVSGDGIRWMLSHTVSNFIDFAPVGTVLVAILGIGLAEHSGLLGALLERVVRIARGWALTASIVFAGVLSSLGADSGYVVLVPLAGLAFASAGRHPLAGIAAAFAGVSGGYSANLAIGPLDAILAGLSTEAVRLVAEDSVASSDNYYFMLASTLLITLVGTLVSQRWVEPRLPRWQGKINEDKTTETAPRFRWVGIYCALFIAALLWAAVPEGALLRNQQTGGLIGSPLLSGIVTLIAVFAAGAGIVFGHENGRYRRADDWIEGMEQTMATMASYLVLMFFAAQFVNYFAWSGLGAIGAIKGAALLATFELSAGPLLISFILLCATINLVIGSASAKWALLAPIFVPMLYLLGISPEATQLAYRIGDSSTNIITPLMPYFGVVVAFAQRYDKDLGIGTLMAMMLPYSLAFLVGWAIMLLVWMGLGWPIGPGEAGFLAPSP
ncbi:aminobenzoyl-glutamate transport protein [Litorivivens lipolytica]|uniref:Aminobenzoyl-glutamate transport protein n=1 Tax=Litorivivens lipolytica TaxID=1524264 RepID=A0A7W4Z5L5_9GAMM|nr:AbgT family transporter [Litorivivens lipolytica]MBB3046096.1 aminobenzoyl-glutamate transport protein [Litorivivens lipolytica]